MRPTQTSTLRPHVLPGLFAAGAACLLSACANFTEVFAEDGEGTYNLSATGISYMISMPALTAASRDKANAYCAGQDKEMQLRQQARSWKPLHVELSFRCLPRPVGQLEASNRPASLTVFK